MKLLVTGAKGFIGSAFVKIAAKTMVCISVPRPYRKLPPVDYVVHLAARTAKSKDDDVSLSKYRRDNVLSTKILLSALSRKPSYFLYVSTKDVDKKPLTPYARSKYETEKIVMTYCTKYAIPFGIARLGSVFGPGEGAYGKVIPIFIRSVLAGEKLHIVRGSRKFIYVGDVAKTLIYMIKNKQTGIVQIEGKKEIATGDLARYVRDAVHGRKTPMHGLAQEIAWFKKQRTVIFDVDGTLINHTKRQLIVRKAYKTKKERRAHIESPELLSLDTVFPGVKETLLKLSREYRLIAVSNRQNGKNLTVQLSRLGLARYFTDIIAVGPVKPEVAKLKAFKQILATYSLLPDQVTVIGDSDVEKSAASALGIRFVRSTKNI